MCNDVKHDAALECRMRKLLQVKGITFLWWGEGNSFWRIRKHKQAWTIELGRLQIDNFSKVEARAKCKSC